jgi:hypothetical protein
MDREVAADGFHTDSNHVFLAVNLDTLVLGTVLVNLPPDGAFALIVDEQNILRGFSIKALK